ncbi:hypothetical protein DB346_24035 [Verrucomicrobia bacterium LW23]|nr:hypothetical protein DB346_24035 [Verrucomicrobia bacterium LW23]
MGDWIINLLTGESVPAGSEWRLSFEGLSPGWAVVLFIALSAGAIAGYVLYAKDVPKHWQRVMMALRIVLIGLVLLLLTKPVVHMTINEPVRQNLLVLVDTSSSMLLGDRRVSLDDQKRAALAAGTIDPAQGLKQSFSGPLPPELAGANRWDVLARVNANEKLRLWERLQEKSNLSFYRFGRDAVTLGVMEPAGGRRQLDKADISSFFQDIRPTDSATGIGEGMRQVLEQNRGQAIAGMLVITDGANNSGLPPGEAARIALEQNIPLFIYGIGVTTPADLIVQELSAPKLAFVKQRVDVKFKLRAQGFTGRQIVATLKSGNKVLAEEKVVILQDGEQEVALHFTPQELGDLTLEASVPALPEEVAKENNKATAKMRVVDNKIHVLFIDQEPRWDYRYLLFYLQHSPKIDVKTYLIDGEPDLDKMPDSVFLQKLPDNRESLFKYELLILGDVDPKSLGENRMKLIREWVEQSSGGIIFLAGTKYNPIAYAGTPLEELLPVVPDATVGKEAYAARSRSQVSLRLTTIGASSPYLQLSEKPEENQTLWASFPGVRWTAAVSRAKPGAQVLMVDPRPERAGRDGALPVFATQSYGSGETVYIGTDETYRWRSKVGVKHYAQVWDLVMQSLSLQRLQGASSRTQLKVDRQRYFVGDKVVISGKVYNDRYEPLTNSSLQGNVKIATRAPDGKVSETQQRLDIMASGDGASPAGGASGTPVSASATTAGEYRGELTVKVPGEYSFSTLQDPGAVLKFEVVEPKLEQMETAMDERLMKSTAAAGRGRFLREEDLYTLPGMITDQSATVATFRKVNLFYSLWWLVAIVFIASLEWLMRRLLALK